MTTQISIKSTGAAMLRFPSIFNQKLNCSISGGVSYLLYTFDRGLFVLICLFDCLCAHRYGVIYCLACFVDTNLNI